MVDGVDVSRAAGPGVWSHRGRVEDGTAVENTAAAFAAASGAGVDGIELDVWWASDGRLLVRHDREIAGVGHVDDLPAGLVPDDVPTLEQALEACSVAVVNVELKVPPEVTGAAAGRLGARLADPLAAAARSCRAELVVSSFSWDALTGFGERSMLPIGLLSSERPRADELDEMVQLGWRAVHVHLSRWDRDLLASCTERGLSLVVWTVNDDDDLRSALGAPLRAVITDRPRRALELSGGRAGAAG